MIDRTTLLREIGLTPVWRAREASSRAVGNEVVLAQSNDANVDLPNVLPANLDKGAPLPAAHRESAPPGVAVETTQDRAARIATLDWDELSADISACRACKLCQTRTNAVPGVGQPAPDWMVIGEGPGEQEDKQGEPFVGRAGQLLDQMLAAVEKSRNEDVFIANVVKCRPPGNRDPQPDEIAACAPYLERQIALAKPKLLLALGKFAGQTLLASDASVASMRAAPGVRGGIPVVVTYHPAYLLRSPLEKEKAWADLVAAKRLSTPTSDDAQ